MEGMSHCPSHLVGSISLPDAESVFRTVAEHLPEAPRIPDGEVGERFYWIQFQTLRFDEATGLDILGYACRHCSPSHYRYSAIWGAQKFAKHHVLSLLSTVQLPFSDFSALRRLAQPRRESRRGVGVCLQLT